MNKLWLKCDVSLTSEGSTAQVLSPRATSCSAGATNFKTFFPKNIRNHEKNQHLTIRIITELRQILFFVEIFFGAPKVGLCNVGEVVYDIQYT